MSFKGSMIKDIDPSKLGQENWPHAENIVITDPVNQPSNYKGNLIHGVLDLTAIIIGAIPYADGIIIFKTGGVTDVILKVANDGTVTTIIADNLLNFTTSRPIDGVVDYNLKGELIVAWWEGTTTDANPPRILNIDNLPFAVDGSFALVNPDDIDLLLLFPPVCPTDMTLDTINNSGGNLKTGSYNLFIFYEYPDGTRTPYKLVGRSVNIISEGEFIDPFQGNDSGLVTTKSFDVTMTDVDDRFDRIGIGLIYKSGGVLSSYITSVGTITGTTMSFSIAGIELEDIELSEVLVPKTILSKCKTGTIYNKSLYLANVAEYDTRQEDIDVQTFINGITVEWSVENDKSIDVENNGPGNNYRDQVIVYNQRGFRPGEVYALYAGIHFTDGRLKVYHIPGRAAKTGKTWANYSDQAFNSGNPASSFTFDEDELISDIIAANPGVNLKNLDEAIAIDPNAKFFQFFDTSESNGTIGFWENNNEVYPDGFPTLAGQNVRHHRMPDLHALKRYVSNGELFFDPAAEGVGHISGVGVRPLGLVFKNVTAPANLDDKICKIEFFYAARTTGNSTVRDNCYLTNPNTEELPFDVTQYTSNLRMHPFTMLRTKSDTNISYIRTNYKGRHVSSLSLSVGPLYEFDDEDVDLDQYFAIRQVEDVQYLPANVITPVIDNTDRESALHAKLSNVILDFVSASSPNPPEVDERSVNVDLITHRTNVYQSYINQELVSMGEVVESDVGTTSTIYGGDTFITTYGWKYMQLITGFPDDPHTLYFPVWSTDNINLRQIGDEEWQLFYPYDDPNNFTPDAGLDYVDYDNYIEYNTDYSSVVNNGELVVNESPEEVISNFPYSIYRSVIQADETSEIAWRTFLIEDKYEMPHNKGEIWVLATFNRSLIIHHKYALFVAVQKDRLLSGETEIALGRGDLFTSIPDEVVPDDKGYFGTESQWASFVCKLGYVSVDRRQGKIAIFDGTFKEISAEGMKNFFEEFSAHTIPGGFTEDFDNPFTNNGWTGTYDEKHNRLIFAKLSKDSRTFVLNEDKYNSFTISYVPGSGWECFHNWLPSYLCYNRETYFSVSNTIDTLQGSLWKHNVGAYGVFFGGSPVESFIDLPLAFQEESGKTYKSIKWVTKITDSSGNIAYKETIDSIMVYNDHQTTGIQDIVLKTALGLDYNTARNIKGEWFFNSLRDVAVDPSNVVVQNTGEINVGNVDTNRPYFKKSRMDIRFIIVRLIYKNTNDKKFTLLSLDFEVKKARQ